MEQLQSRHVRFNREHITETPLPKTVAEVQDAGDDFHWLQFTYQQDKAVLPELFSGLQIPDLFLEQVNRPEATRPSVKIIDNWLLFDLRVISPGAAGPVPGQNNRLQIIMGKQFLLSIHYGATTAIFDKVHERLANGQSRSRELGTDFLCYELLDAVVEGYYQVLDGIGDEIDKFEQSIFTFNGNKKISRVLHGIRNSLLTVRKALYPLRDVIYDLERLINTPFSEGTKGYLHDLYNRCMQELETIDLYRELLASLQDLYLSNLSQRLNEIMKVLTVITVIFIPLSFITGFYGMNIDIPELHYPYLYPIIVIGMIVLTIGMLVIFKKKKWL
jgi:magnesium transporter